MLTTRVVVPAFRAPSLATWVAKVTVEARAMARVVRATGLVLVEATEEATTSRAREAEATKKRERDTNSGLVIIAEDKQPQDSPFVVEDR